MSNYGDFDARPEGIYDTEDLFEEQPQFQELVLLWLAGFDLMKGKTDAGRDYIGYASVMERINFLTQQADKDGVYNYDDIYYGSMLTAAKIKLASRRLTPETLGDE